MTLEDPADNRRVPIQNEVFHNGFRTWRFDSASGNSCILLTTKDDWKNKDTKSESCDCKDLFEEGQQPRRRGEKNILRVIALESPAQKGSMNDKHLNKALSDITGLISKLDGPLADELGHMAGDKARAYRSKPKKRYEQYMCPILPRSQRPCPCTIFSWKRAAMKPTFFAASARA